MIMNEAENFRNWEELWMKACEDNVFPGSNIDPYINEKPKSAQDDYWNQIYTGELLQEEASEPANPVYADSIKKDSDNPYPAWLSDENIQKLDELKKKLHDLEDSMNRHDGGDHKWVEKGSEKPDNKFGEQINQLKKQIDGISDKLGHTDQDNWGLRSNQMPRGKDQPQDSWRNEFVS